MLLIECAKGETRKGTTECAALGAFVCVYLCGSCSRPSRSATGSREKKHSRAVDKLEYLPVDVLRSAECRRGSMIFPQVNTADGCARILAKGRPDSRRIPPLHPPKKETEDDRRDEKGGRFIYVSLLLAAERKNTPTAARLISLILASGARSLKK